MTRRRVLLLVLVAAALTFPLGAGRKLWVLDEVRYAAVVEEMHETGRWFGPYLNGEFFHHKPPLYFWLVGSITALTGQSEFILYVIAWLLSLACVVTTYFLLRALVPERTAWLGAVVMASSFLYAVVTGIARMDLMMVTFMLLGLLAFVRGYMTGRRGLYAWFFVFCALAVMTKGPYGIVLPLVAVLAFLAWERRLKEAVSPWFFGGFLIGLGIVGVWLALLTLVEGPHVLRDYIVKQTLGRMAGSWAHAEPFWYYAAYLPLEFLPWVAFVPCGFALLRRRHPVAFRFMLVLAVTNLVVLSAVSCKLWVYILPIWPALAVAAAVRLRHALVEGASKWFKIEATVTGGLLLAMSVAAQLLCQHIFPEKTASVLPVCVGLSAFGVLAIVAAWLPALSTGRTRAVLVGSVLVVTGLTFSRVTALVLTPEFNDVMSPKTAGELMRQYADDGYALATCGVPIGTYNYYARQRIIPEIQADEVQSFLAENPRAVVAIRKKALDELHDVLPDLLRTGEHVLERKTHYLVVKGEGQGGPD
jgi:4-amino-4-deoxy-L-arabinose transferase-like glycosyltransferase